MACCKAITLAGPDARVQSAQHHDMMYNNAMHRAAVTLHGHDPDQPRLLVTKPGTVKRNTDMEVGYAELGHAITLSEYARMV